MLLLVNSNCISFNGPQDFISIVYRNGNFDSTVSISCNDLNKMAKRKDIDTIITVSQDEFKRIKTFIRNNIDSTEQSCDARIILENNSCKICIDAFDCICGKSDICEDLDIIYLIKCKSGFYNHWSKDDMLFDRCIEKYGIPKDYHLIIPDLFNLKSSTKVVIYKSSNKNKK